MFKVGDKVRRIKGSYAPLVEGHIYTVRAAGVSGVEIEEGDTDFFYSTQCFELVTPDQTNPQSSGGLRYDDGKAPMHLLCPLAMEGIANVMGAGAKKYAPHNWQKGMAWSKVIACLLRHIFALMRGEDLDKETGLPHVDHIGANAMFLCNYYRNHKALDDRYSPTTVTR